VYGVPKPLEIRTQLNGRTLRAVDERRFKDVLVVVLAVVLLAAIYWAVHYGWK
jgi:hypothetical protein